MDYFQLGPIPADAMTGTYSPSLVILSYIMACLASYIALDVTERIRSDIRFKPWWLVSGALAMGCGIWTMHFIGMQAFIMPMPMSYEPYLTALSLIIAVVASGFAFYTIKDENVRIVRLILGGILLGLGICSMHYMGMAAMEGVRIRYLPGLFALSVAIAVLTSKTALYLMIMGSKKIFRYRQQVKLGSACIMGLAICGMHYTGMAAAVFTHPADSSLMVNRAPSLTPDTLSIYIALITVIIMSIALLVSKYWVQVLNTKNKQLLEAEAVLQKQSLDLSRLVEEAVAKEERIRAILTAAADGIVVTDDQGTIEICNRSAAMIFEDSIENILGKNIVQLIHTQGSGEPFPLLLGQLDSLREFTIQRLDGSSKPIELAISKSLLNSKASYVVVFRDIEERKHAEENLAQLNQQLVSTARLAGMAEVATSVLHNVGNVLNSVNVSVNLLLEKDHQSKISGLAKIAELLEKNEQAPELFLKQHPVGQKLPEYLKQLADFWQKEHQITHKELEELNHRVQHIKNIVAMQQSLSIHSMIEPVALDKLFEDALALNSELIEKAQVTVKRDFEKLPPIEIDRVKIVQILVNLIKNGVEAILDGSNRDRILTLRTRADRSNYVRIEVEDNGKGIRQEDLTRIFSYGFTTKRYGHGFGLHSSSLSAQDSGGTLKAYSDGQGKGAIFVLVLPIRANRKRKSDSELRTLESIEGSLERVANATETQR